MRCVELEKLKRENATVKDLARVRRFNKIFLFCSYAGVFSG